MIIEQLRNLLILVVLIVIGSSYKYSLEIK